MQLINLNIDNKYILVYTIIVNVSLKELKIMSDIIARTSIKGWGNSLAIRLPKKIIDALSLKDGSEIKISLDGGKVILESVEFDPFFELSRDLNLSEMLSKITPENQHSNEDSLISQKSVGKEIW